MSVFRLAFLGEESPLRRADEWTILAENWETAQLTFRQAQRIPAEPHAY